MKYSDVTSHDIACKITDRNPNAMPDVSMRPEYQKEVIVALTKLMDIGDAINKVDDNFQPLFDGSQPNWYPTFDGNQDFACSLPNDGSFPRGKLCVSRVYFRNRLISDFFGKQFNELHKQVLTFKK